MSVYQKIHEEAAKKRERLKLLAFLRNARRQIQENIERAKQEAA